ncbi:MAG: DUF1292 domain-containing protein [Oscillospiraceae bacterium]
MEDKNQFRPDLFTLTDEDGKEQLFELLDTMVIDDINYYALTPHYENPSDMLNDDGELVILKDDPNCDGLDPENVSLVTIDNEEELNHVGELFLERINAMFDAMDDDDDDQQ